MSIEDIKTRIAQALANNDDALFMQLLAQAAKEKSTIAKSEADRLKAEAEQLAGAREKLAAKLVKAVKTVVEVADLEAVKAKGFTFNLPDETSDIATVALKVPTVRKAGGGTGGGAGKSKDEFGMSLGDIFDKFASQADKDKLAAATSGSLQWQVKVAVKKEAIKAGRLQPVK